MVQVWGLGMHFTLIIYSAMDVGVFLFEA